MRKNYCDCCNDEISGVVHGILVLCHLVEGNYYSTNINGTWEPTSGREVKYDLCLPCYNEIFGAAINKMKEIKTNSIVKKFE